MKFIMILLLMLSFSATCAADERTEDTITLKVPPKILAQWYKPANKRQVWLHTMFRLRREVQAMAMYAQQGRQADLEKWSNKFAKDYKSIAKMVPQWQNYLYLDKLEELEKLVKSRDYSGISLILKKIGKSCMHCHDDYQTVATLLYRSADFNEQMVMSEKSKGSIGYDEMMSQLSNSVNRINIAIKDGYFDEAQEEIPLLEQQLHDLSANCSNCHEKDLAPVERIFGASHELLPELKNHLNQKEQSMSGRKLGEFAVKVCARCHSIHRLTSDLKNQLE